jgi:EAL and modified HD-GYP domain-containing signal transduction protein
LIVRAQAHKKELGSLERFLARQPIFNWRRVVYGYELLFRSGLDNFFSHTDADAASASTADAMILFGIERLTEGKRAFLNCTREFLIRDYAMLLPKDRVVIEILEGVKLDEELIAACRRLKAQGYLLALDDFKDSKEWEPLISVADFIKVDLLATPAEEQSRLAKSFASDKLRLVAEKVETHEDFKRTFDLGYSYFQGYFFSRPEILRRHDIPANKLNYLRLLQAANQSDMDIQSVADRVKAEASISYRLLRYLNSSAFFLASEVHSIPHALSLLGERGIRRWVSLVAVACMADDKPQELVMLPLIRARFCELLAPRAGLANVSNDLFLLGLLSAIDAILDMTMADILDELKLREDIRDALLGRKNGLRDVFDVALLYEMARWEELDAAAQHVHIQSDDVPGQFMEAVDWSKRILTDDSPDK